MTARELAEDGPARRQGVPMPDGRFDTPVQARRDDATTILSYLLSGPLVFGGAGYGLDHLLGTTFIVAIGVLIGLTLGIYVVWLRYGGT